MSRAVTGIDRVCLSFCSSQRVVACSDMRICARVVLANHSCAGSYLFDARKYIHVSSQQNRELGNPTRQF